VVITSVIFLGVVMLACLVGAAVIPAFDGRLMHGTPGREILRPRRVRDLR